MIVIKINENAFFSIDTIIASTTVSKFLTIFVYHNSGKHTISESDNPTFFSSLSVYSTALDLLLYKFI
jgi:hypothetical protein